MLDASYPAIEPALSNVSPAQKDLATPLWSNVFEVLDQVERGTQEQATEGPRSDAVIDVVSLGLTCGDLREFLFSHAMVVVKDTMPINRYPIEFVLPSHLEQLVAYLRAPITPADVAADLTWLKPSTTLFLEQWLSDTQVQIPTMSDLFGPVPLFVEPVGHSSSASAAEKAWSKRIREMRNDLVDTLRIAPSVSVANEAALRAESAASQAESQAGGAASSTLAAHFEKLATEERASARSWSGLAVGSLVVSAIVALVVLWVGAESNLQWVEQLLHLALTLPFVALTAYASTVASRHRHQAWWAKTTAAQLHTVSPFVLPLNADDRSMVLSQLGVRVFGQAAFNTSEARPETASVLAPVQSLLSRSANTSGPA
ncbi:hypothetical protein O4220_00320 [Rhodococcus ruber]|uniref:DUF2207 domain-containing protein n=1 Tax=Rhodococcus ruber TaxID=1830 RepID=A0ABT4M8J5_9NOCA|nr:hypothetical protein [Rhodococcus ruber]MCZ4516940.1 hypothetical protein [Rhodococcus ruber]